MRFQFSKFKFMIADGYLVIRNVDLKYISITQHKITKGIMKNVSQMAHFWSNGTVKNHTFSYFYVKITGLVYIISEKLCGNILVYISNFHFNSIQILCNLREILYNIFLQVIYKFYRISDIGCEINIKCLYSKNS